MHTHERTHIFKKYFIVLWGKIFENHPSLENWSVYIMIFPTVLEFFTSVGLGKYVIYARLVSVDARDQVLNFKKSHSY